MMIGTMLYFEPLGMTVTPACSLSSDCRIKGEFISIKEVVLIMLSESWKNWEIDMLSTENNEYKKLYNKIKRSKF